MRQQQERLERQQERQQQERLQEQLAQQEQQQEQLAQQVLEQELLLSCHKRPKPVQTMMQTKLTFSCLIL